MYSSAKLKSNQSTSRNTAKIACSVRCIISSGFEIKEQEDGYPFWYTASKHKSSLRERLCFNLPREVSVGEAKQPAKLFCWLHFLFFCEDLLAVWAGQKPSSHLQGGLPRQGSVTKGNTAQGNTTNGVCAALHTVILPASCQVVCFVLFFLWICMKRPVCYNMDSLWEIIRHRKVPRETRGR